MAFNGSGTFNRLYNWVSDRDANIHILAQRMDDEMDGFATGLTTCITKNGQTTTTARVPFSLGISLGDGSVGAPCLNFISDADCGLYYISANKFGIAAGGAQVLDISTAGLSITGTLAASGISSLIATTITSASATALAVGRLGTTTPALQVDASTATSITGVKVKSAASGGGVAISAIGETNVALTIDAAGSGTITIGGTSTGAITLSRATTLSAALTYGGVTLSNAVSGTGNMALSAGTTFTGTTTIATLVVNGGTGGRVSFGYDSSVIAGLVISTSNSATGGELIKFLDSTSSNRGSITWGAGQTSVAYNTTSDRALKFDEQPFARAGAIIDATPIWDFAWKGTTTEIRGVGVFAQDAYKLFPDAITPPVRDGDSWQVDYSKYVPVLIADAQETHQRLARAGL